MSFGSSASWLPSSNKPRRPAAMDPAVAADIPGGIDPQTSGEVAHMTAGIMVHRGRAQAEPEVIERLITLVDREGIDVVAGMWADSPANTLPGVLWRMYALREQVRKNPDLITALYRAGLAAAEVEHAVAGVIEPPEPADVLALLDTVLSGLFTGDFAVALERAAAFIRVLSTGAAHDAQHAASGRALVRVALEHSQVALDLTAAAKLWRKEKLD